MIALLKVAKWVGKILRILFIKFSFSPKDWFVTEDNVAPFSHPYHNDLYLPTFLLLKRTTKADLCIGINEGSGAF